MSLRTSTFALSVLIALSSHLAWASGDDPTPPRPKCTSDQVRDPKTNTCKPLVSSRTGDDARAAHAYSLADAIAQPTRG